MPNSNSVAIAVSDDDPEESGRVRARVRRKRKKPHGQRGELTQRAVRFLLRYWAVLVFLPAAGLLLFEASRIGGAREGGAGPGPPAKKPEKTLSDGNLNRLDPTTHVVGGVRERCLKILSPEELDRLDVPIRGDVGGPVRSVVYVTGAGAQVGAESSLSGRLSGAARFNLFTGYQTFEEREMSFKVKETADVHCGFYSEAGGFRISEEDRRYMESCTVVVSTCAFGGGDDLYQPIGMTEASVRKVCYAAFWDEVTLAAQESAGHKIEEDGYIGKWRIIIVKDLPFSDQRLNGKIPKMLAHRLFTKAKYSIWVDSKSQFRRDPLGVLEALLWRTDSVLAISEHGARSSIYDEAKAVVKKHKATPEEVEVQVGQYRQDGMPEDKRLNGKKALNEASVIVREHTLMTNLFMCLWFNEAVRFTSRDQLSFPYVLWRLKGPKNINMFPVCTRKDLVNSMGHLRKAKPLGQ